MKLMSKFVGIFIFAPNIYFTIDIRLNSIVTLGSNQGGAIKSKKN